MLSSSNRRVSTRTGQLRGGQAMTFAVAADPAGRTKTRSDPRGVGFPRLCVHCGNRRPGGLYVPTGVLGRGPQVVRVVRSDRFGAASVPRG